MSIRTNAKTPFTDKAKSAVCSMASDLHKICSDLSLVCLQLYGILETNDIKDYARMKTIC